jgi:acetyltransferase
VIAVGRLIKLLGRDDAEFALVVADRYQRHWQGEQLLRRLLQFARDEGGPAGRCRHPASEHRDAADV